MVELALAVLVVAEVAARTLKAGRDFVLELCGGTTARGGEGEGARGRRRSRRRTKEMSKMFRLKCWLAAYANRLPFELQRYKLSAPLQS